jgi:hypothetical protein
VPEAEEEEEEELEVVLPPPLPCGSQASQSWLQARITLAARMESPAQERERGSKVGMLVPHPYHDAPPDRPGS